METKDVLNRIDALLSVVVKQQESASFDDAEIFWEGYQAALYDLKNVLGSEAEIEPNPFSAGGHRSPGADLRGDFIWHKVKVN